MEKLRLTVDDLQVQSFLTTRSDERQEGTVRAHETGFEANCPSAWGSCEDTCEQTCQDTCRESCGCYEGTWWFTMC